MSSKENKTSGAQHKMRSNGQTSPDELQKNQQYSGHIGRLPIADVPQTDAAKGPEILIKTILQEDCANLDSGTQNIIWHQPPQQKLYTCSLSICPCWLTRKKNIQVSLGL